MIKKTKNWRMIISKALLLIILLLPVFGFSQQKDSTHTNTKISFKQGGDIRVQYFHFDNQDWEKNNNSNYLLTRFLWNAALNFGDNHQIKVEFQSGLANGIPKPVSPVDENVLDLHQAYYKYTLNTGKETKLAVIAGRQELQYGSQRIISVREGPNNRQSFDALKVKFEQKDLTLDAFISTYVQAKTGFFNDKFLNQNNILWGIYAVKKNVPLIQNLDIYYLGIKRNKEVINLHTYETKKHSLGLRVWEGNSNFTYDLEALLQWGKSKTEDRIKSSTASAHITYKFDDWKWKPILGIKAQYISGDKDTTDKIINTFDPIYPKGAYFGLSPIIGPKNLTNIHVYSKLNPIQDLTVSLEYIYFWRNSTQDAVYDVGGNPLINSLNQKSKNIGSQFQISPQYHLKEKLVLMGDFAYFKTDQFLKESDAVDLFSAALGIQYSF